MKKGESLKTWGIVFALMIFAGLASALVPVIIDELGGGSDATAGTTQESTAITIDVENMLLGDELIKIKFIEEQIHGRRLEVWQVLAITSGIVLISVGSLGFILTGAMQLLSKRVMAVYADEGFQEAQAELNKKQQEAIKNWQQTRPTFERDKPEAHAKGTAYVFSFIIILLVWVAGLALGESFFADTTWNIGNISLSASMVVNVILVLVTLAVLFLAARSQGASQLFSGKSENIPVNWGVIWVIVSGLLIVGLGTGVAIAFISG